MQQAKLPSLSPILGNYLKALAIAGVVVALRFLVDPLVGQTGFILLLSGILLIAWLCGVGPCLVAQTLILVVHARYFAKPSASPWPPSLQSVVNMSAFYGVGLSVAVLSELVHAARNRARAKTNEVIAQHEQLRAILTCMGDGMLVTDATGRIILLNPVAERLIGTTMPRSRGKPLADVLALREAESRRATIDPAQQVIRQRRTIHSDVPLMLDGVGKPPIPIAYSAAPIQDAAGQLTGTVVLIRDESQRCQTEEALRSADRRKDEFLAMLAHELRNPLAPICMGLELMKIAAANAETVEETRSMVERQARHMVRLIDDLLDVSRITRGKLGLRKARVNLQTIVDQAVEATRPLFEAAHHLLTLRLPEHPVLLDADRDRLTQVLSNLLNNAAKYTPPGGRIELTATVHDQQLTIRVVDNGRGISAAQLPTVFDMFIQASAAAENGHTGLGIGLTLVKSLVELHGGAVEAHSDGPGQGSSFVIRLPLPQSELLETSQPTPIDVAGQCHTQARRVLLVDDNQDSLQAMMRLVTALGHETHIARDGLEAILVAENCRPEVILMDLGMPRMNGYDAACEIRARAWGRQVRLVAVTGWGQPANRQRTQAAGFDDHLVKPVDSDTLARALAVDKADNLPGSRSVDGFSPDDQKPELVGTPGRRSEAEIELVSPKPDRHATND